MAPKTFAFISCFFFLCSIFCVSAKALTYTDGMESAASTNNIQYANLAPYLFSDAAAQVLPDSEALTVADISNPVAYAQYRVQGASTVSASIYSHAGTYAVQSPDGTYVLGSFNDNANNIPALASQAFFCPSTQSVYLDSRASMQLHLNHMYAYVFHAVKDPPKSTLIGYGINFYYSQDGAAFTRANAERTGFQANMAALICHETYSASIPASAKYIRVEINDTVNLPLLSGGYFQKDRKQITSLASVNIYGDSLIFGEPEPEVAVSPSIQIDGGLDTDDEGEAKPPKEKEEEEEEYDETFYDAANYIDDSDKSSSSKFEGTITSSSKSDKKSAPSSSESEKEEKKTSSVPEVSDVVPTRDDVVIYEISGAKDENKLTDSLLTGGIILASGGILLYLLLGKNKSGGS